MISKEAAASLRATAFLRIMLPYFSEAGGIALSDGSGCQILLPAIPAVSEASWVESLPSREDPKCHPVPCGSVEQCHC